jgi:hypothetical protein
MLYFTRWSKYILLHNTHSALAGFAQDAETPKHVAGI